MRFISVFLLSICLIACNKPSSNTLVVGTIAGPETDLVEVARDLLKKDGITVKIIQFNDYNLPNEALQDGSLDANVYQHLPYLNEAMEAHHYDLTAIGKTFVYPTAIYSNRFKSLDQLPENATIAIPNDPSNEVRALLLLRKAGLIELTKDNVSTLAGISKNPKHINFIELDAAQLPRVLSDVDAAVINTTFAIPAGLDPTKDSLFSEDKNSPYANLIVVKDSNKKQAQLDLFVKAMNSEEVKAKAQELFGDAAIPAW